MKGYCKPWTKANLDAYLTKPAQAVPGNNMPFGGVADSKARDAITTYLATLK